MARWRGEGQRETAPNDWPILSPSLFFFPSSLPPFFLSPHSLSSTTPIRLRHSPKITGKIKIMEKHGKEGEVRTKLRKRERKKEFNKK
jgi:hypothetical protein